VLDRLRKIVINDMTPEKEDTKKPTCWNKQDHVLDKLLKVKGLKHF